MTIVIPATENLIIACYQRPEAFGDLESTYCYLSEVHQLRFGHFEVRAQPSRSSRGRGRAYPYQL